MGVERSSIQAMEEHPKGPVLDKTDAATEW